jgi:radical SAM protein with 4Fe4S-binding SPASM domain
MSDYFEKMILAGLSPPKRVTLMMTNYCNLSCGHCWPQSSPVDSFLPVPAPKLNRLIRELNRLKVDEICLTGGEPLTHPDWFDVLRHACSMESFNQVTLQTNATLLDETVAGQLLELDCNRIQIQVSLDGGKSETHDRVRGKGSFKRTLKGLRTLSEKGLAIRTLLAFTEMEHNFSDLPLILEIADDLGVSACVSGTLVSKGRAKMSDLMLPPTPVQYRRLLNLYETDQGFRSRYDRLGNISALEWLKGRNSSSGQVCTCIETPFIDEKGNIYPCLYLQAPLFAAKGVYERSFAVVVMDAMGSWQELPKLYHRRQEELISCKICPGWQHCRGGCAGRAYATTLDLMAVEDRCALRKVVYSWKKIL